MKKKILSLFMAAVMLITTMIPLGASAAEAPVLAALTVNGTAIWPDSNKTMKANVHLTATTFDITATLKGAGAAAGMVEAVQKDNVHKDRIAKNDATPTTLTLSNYSVSGSVYTIPIIVTGNGGSETYTLKITNRAPAISGELNSISVADTALSIAGRAITGTIPYGATVAAVGDINNNSTVFATFKTFNFATLGIAPGTAFVFEGTGAASSTNLKFGFVRAADSKVQVYAWDGATATLIDGTAQKLNVYAENGNLSNSYTFFLKYAAPNTDALITSFRIANTNAVIKDRGITVNVPYGTKLNGLVPTFTASAGATVTVGGNSITSGKTPLDFSHDVEMLVVSEDGSKRNSYNVKVSVAATPAPTPSDKTIAYPVTGGNIYFCDGVITRCDHMVTAAEIPPEINGQKVTSIGRGAFFNCTSLTSITLPDSLTRIEEAVFSGCSGLTGITLPDSLTSIGNSAFYGCSGLTGIEIPASVISIGTNPFLGCVKLPEIEVSPENSVYCSVDGVLFSKDMTELLAYSAGKSGTVYQIPDGVTKIGSWAFSNCTGLTGVEFPDGVTAIGSGGGFISLTTSIGSDAFHGCTSLTAITLPDGVTSIERSTFYGCSSLTGITLPDSLTSIGEDAFSYCSSLTDITIPDNVTSIGFYAFGYCTSLTSITLPDSLTRIEEAVFSGCSGLTGITLPDSLTSIGNSAFYGCSGLTGIEIPASVISIGTNPFLGCVKLPEIEVSPENSVYCSVDGVLFSKDMTELLAYSAGKSGTVYQIPDGVTRIGDHAFSNCTGLTGVTFPEGVTVIGSGAFFCCFSLTGSITLPNGVMAIGSGAFKVCSSLSDITIPDSVTEIGGSAFSGCPSLTSATFLGDAIDVSDASNLFWGCAESFTIYYDPSKTGWTTPTWNGYSCYPIETKPEPTPTPTPTPSTPTPPVTPSNPEPTVETETSPDGTVTTTTTWPDGKKAVQEKTPDGGAKVEVTSPTGETIAKIDLPADPGAGKDFEDVKEGAWYEGAVDKATAYGLFNGTSDTAFTPDGSMTRGMVAQVLYNLSGKTGYGTGSGNFTDVTAGKWYENAIDWAAKAEIVSGTGNGNFSPEQSVTREQLVTMLYRYAQAIGADTKASAGLGSFPDSGEVTDYAETAMKWAVAEGFISGREQSGGNYIAPKGTATRAEVAAILTRFVEFLK